MADVPEDAALQEHLKEGTEYSRAEADDKYYGQTEYWDAVEKDLRMPYAHGHEQFQSYIWERLTNHDVWDHWRDMNETNFLAYMGNFTGVALEYL